MYERCYIIQFFIVKICSFNEVLRNFAKQVKTKFHLNSFAKFCETGTNLSSFVFRKTGKTKFRGHATPIVSQTRFFQTYNISHASTQSFMSPSLSPMPLCSREASFTDQTLAQWPPHCLTYNRFVSHATTRSLTAPRCHLGNQIVSRKTRLFPGTPDCLLIHQTVSCDTRLSPVTPDCLRGRETSSFVPPPPLRQPRSLGWLPHLVNRAGLQASSFFPVNNVVRYLPMETDRKVSRYGLQND
jgi:hypothetical protein